MNKDNALLFLNTPARSNDEDVIGISTYVEKLNAAINSDAQMIAITSPFGAGKTSAIEMLQHSRANMSVDSSARFVSRLKLKLSEKKRIKSEKIINISMWVHIAKDKNVESANTTELHRSFVYQFASQINQKKGTYLTTLKHTVKEVLF